MENSMAAFLLPFYLLPSHHRELQENSGALLFYKLLPDVPSNIRMNCQTESSAEKDFGLF